MLLLEATKLSADPKFSEFKLLMALAHHAINLTRTAWFWSFRKKHTPPVSLPSTISKVVDLLITFCTFLQCILQSAFCTDRMLNTIFQ